jgi:hypothetical protein
MVVGMSAKHTPGPWRNGLDANGNPIVCQKYDGDLFGSEPNEEYQANCRLVDAAPDLLEALMRLLPMAEDDAFQYGGKPDEDGDIIFARAAIAKATGEKA